MADKISPTQLIPNETDILVLSSGWQKVAGPGTFRLSNHGRNTVQYRYKPADWVPDSHDALGMQLASRHPSRDGSIADTVGAGLRLWVHGAEAGHRIALTVEALA